MVMKFISRLMNTGRGHGRDLTPHSFPTAPLFAAAPAEVMTDDPEFPGRSPSEVRRLREERASAKRENDRLIDADREEAKEEQHLLLLTLAGEDQRRMAAQITADIGDARRAIVHVHDRAVLQEGAARELMEGAQSRAIVLANGRRVYFTADGGRLYGEDDRLITDERIIAEARRSHLSSATTYEESVEYRAVWQRAAETTKRLNDALVELDDIETRLAHGHLSAEELRALNEKTASIIKALPADARQEYARIHADRQSEQATAYRAADSAFESVPLLQADFLKAASGNIATAENTTKNDHQTVPTYRAAPEF